MALTVPTEFADFIAARSDPVPFPGELRFGPYRVIPGARQILRDDEPLKLGSRAFDILVALLHAKGTIISREELIRQAWPTTTVDDTNLRFQMACLRRALRDHASLIKTIPGRGYLFAVETAALQASSVPASPSVDFAREPRAALRELLHVAADELWRLVVLGDRGAPDTRPATAEH
jgi:DNA-binding winged helix-turn-helix (wHTH) protein